MVRLQLREATLKLARDVGTHQISVNMRYWFTLVFSFFHIIALKTNVQFIQTMDDSPLDERHFFTLHRNLRPQKMGLHKNIKQFIGIVYVKTIKQKRTNQISWF